MDNICKSCRFATSDLRCNRLVSTCIGRSDRLGSDYKKDNVCPYYKEGTPRNEEKRNINFFNS